MEVFQFDGHMKVGVVFGFLQLGSASGKYVNNMSSSIEQPRMTLRYKETKRYEELDTATVLKLCDNLELLKMAREHEATHFVAGMTYGNQVLMDFKCTRQRDTKNDLLDIQLKGIFSIGQFLADKFNKDDKRIITFDDIQCKIFCEIKDIKEHTSFKEAEQIYKDLPTVLKNVEAVDCVYLLPLSIINKDAKKFNKSDIDEVVMKKLVHIRDDLYEQEMRCDDFGKGNINVSKIKACIQKHTEEMKQSLSSNTPKDWNREIIKHNSSDFERTKLRKRIKESRPKTVRPTCPTCHTEFSEGSEFLTHMGTHQERRQYRCGRCDIPFDTMNELSDHEKTHKNRNRDQVSDDSNSGSNFMGSVAVGAATGALSGVATGAAYGATAVAVLGPVGVAVGGAVGAVICGTVGTGVGAAVVAGVTNIYGFFPRLRGN